MRDWPWISDNALTLYCGVLFVENHTCMHVDETTGKCRSLTQSYKWGFFLWHKSWHLCTCVIPRTSGYSAVCRYFLSCTPSFFSLSLYNPSRQQRMIALFYAYHIYITSLHIRGLKKVSLKKNSARCRVDILLYLYMYHQFVYTHWFFFLLLKATKYSSYYILHKASSHQFDQ